MSEKKQEFPTDPKQPQSVTEIAQRICEELNLARGDDAILMRELRAFRKAVLDEAERAVGHIMPAKPYKDGSHYHDCPGCEIEKLAGEE